MTDKENMMIEALFKQAAQQQIRTCPTGNWMWQDGCHSCGRCSAWWWLVCCSSYLAAGRW